MRTEQNIKNRYVITAGVSAYSANFPLYEDTDVAVYLSKDGGETETLLTKGTHYTVSIAANHLSGTVTLKPSVGAEAGDILFLMSNLPYTQELDLNNVTKIDTQATETQLDRDCQQRQQLAYLAGRAVKVPATSLKTPEQYTNELWQAHDDAVGAANYAAQSATLASEIRDSIADETIVKIDKDMAHGGFILSPDEDNDQIVTLDHYYTVGANNLMMFFNGTHIMPDDGESTANIKYVEVGSIGDKSNKVRIKKPVASAVGLTYQVIGINGAMIVDGDTMQWDDDNGLSVNAEAVLGDVEDVIREDVEDILNYEYQKVDTKAWSADIDYAQGALVTGSDGNLYVSLATSGPETEVVNPVEYGAQTWSNLTMSPYRPKISVKHFIHDDSFLDANSLNGSVCDDDYLYSVYIKVVKVNDVEVNRKAFIQRIDLTSGYIDYLDSPTNTTLAIVEHTEQDPDDQSSTISSLGHANGMTCDEDYLYVATQIDKRIIKLDKKTLQIVETYDMTDKGNKFRSIAYNDADGYFYGLSYSDSLVHIFDSDFNEIGTKTLDFDYTHYTLQAICFKDGEMYGFTFHANSSDTKEYYNYLIRFDKNGRLYQTWLLDISSEVENICAYKDGFIIGVNTTYGSRHDFYTVSLSENTLTISNDIIETDKDIDDYAHGNNSKCTILCKKRVGRTGLVDGVSKTSTYKMVGTGKIDAEFAYLEDAISYAKRIDRMNYFTGQIDLQCSGDFSDKSYELAGLKTRLVFTVIKNKTAKLGPLVITDCNCVQLWNSSVSIELNDATKTESVVAGISAVNSFVLAGVDITNTASPKTGTIGIYSQRGAVVEIPQNITLTNFATGVSFYNGSLIQDDASQITFTDCTAKFTGTRRVAVHVDAANAPAMLANTQADIASPINNLMSNDIRISADGDTKYTHIYRRGDGTNYKGALMESMSGSTTGAYLILRDPDSPAETGWFNLAAKNSTTTVMLLGKPDGSLLWGGNPVQTTSDERKKTLFSRVPDAILDAWGEVDWEQFKYLAAIEEKGGAENCRWHSGLVAQHVQKAFEALGQDACAYGILCHEEWGDEYEEKKIVDVEAQVDEFGNEVVPEQSHIERTLLREAGDLWTVRYTEALCMEAAYQRRRAARAEARLAALERKMEEMEQVIAVLGGGGGDDD